MAESSPVVKVIMDCEAYIKGLVQVCYLGDVDPNTMGLLLNYTAETIKLELETAAFWISEEVERINEGAQDEEAETEPTDETPETDSDKEA